MFSLIITVLSIALVVALSAAAMYYGGNDVLTQGTQEANAARVINEITQIRAATYAFQATEGRAPDSIADLVPKYMATLPAGWRSDNVINVNGVSIEAKQIQARSAEEETAICEAVNKQFGETTTPLCSEITASFSGCCVSP